MPTPPEIRARAADLLSRIIVRKQTIDQVLGSKEQDPLVVELLYGSLRNYFSLSKSVDKALRHPLRIKDHDVWCLMVVGLYQIHHTRIPPHAALNETVEGVRLLGKPWAKALVNAVLRNAGTPEQSFEHPAWMASALEAAYGDLAPAVMIANNERAPMAVRINLSRASPEHYRTMLTEAGLAFRSVAAESANALSWGRETLILQQPVAVQRLPGYAQGLVSVQDAGAQLAAAVLASDWPAALDPHRDASAPIRLLDACAAPGGKFFHLLERCPAFDGVALDSSRTRLETLRREARRLGHERYTAIEADATGIEWWDGILFDRILIDAPCSGSGTLRRHPDIKVLRQAGDLPRYVKVQLALLQSLWRVLRPGGTLLYCTCSLFPAENDDVIGEFMSSHREVEPVVFRLPTGQQTRFGWQLLPTDADTDGFYFSHIRKAAA